MTETEVSKLRKPGESDYISIDDLNHNADIIDRRLIQRLPSDCEGVCDLNNYNIPGIYLLESPFVGEPYINNCPASGQGVLIVTDSTHEIYMHAQQIIEIGAGYVTLHYRRHNSNEKEWGAWRSTTFSDDNVHGEINAMQTTETYQVPLGIWSQSAPYTATIRSPGMTKNDKPLFDLYIPSSTTVLGEKAARKSAACISYIDTGADSFTITCIGKKPTNGFWLIRKGV